MKIKTVNITDQVVEYLKENIESGKWNIGEKIPSENQMVMELGVSRSSIRSALQYLIGIGVLKSYQGKGTFLINTQVENWDEAEYKITSEDCMDICKVLEFRKILEPGACVLAMENCDEKTVAAFTFTIPILPDVTPASLSAFNISFPAVVPAASLSVEKVASASTFAGESTYTILMPASFASFSAEEIASGPFAATMIA